MCSGVLPRALQASFLEVVGYSVTEMDPGPSSSCLEVRGVVKT